MATKPLWKVKDCGDCYLIVDVEFEAAEHNATSYPHTLEGLKACQESLDRLLAECSRWNNAGLSDAPHLDAVL